MLKFKLDKETFDALNDVEKSFYAMAGDGYQLQVDGVADKSKLDEFRATNVDLLKQQEAFKGVDLEKYRELEEKERHVLEGDLIAKKDFEGLIAQRTNSLTSDYQAKIDNLTSQLNDNSNNYNALVSKHEIGGAASKAFSTHSIRPALSEAVLMMVNSKFSIDNGQVVAKDGDNILAGANGNLTVDEYVGSLGEDYKIASTGGRGNGNENNAPMARGQSSADKIRAGLASRMG